MLMVDKRHLSVWFPMWLFEKLFAAAALDKKL